MKKENLYKILFAIFAIGFSITIALAARSHSKYQKMSTVDLAYLPNSFYVYVEENIETGETEGKKVIFLSTTPINELKGLKSLKLYFPSEKPFVKYDTRFEFRNATDLQKFFDYMDYSQEEIEIFKQDEENPIYQIKYSK